MMKLFDLVQKLRARRSGGKPKRPACAKQVKGFALQKLVQKKAGQRKFGDGHRSTSWVRNDLGGRKKKHARNRCGKANQRQANFNGQRQNIIEPGEVNESTPHQNDAAQLPFKGSEAEQAIIIGIAFQNL